MNNPATRGRVAVRRAGRVSQTLETLAEAFKRANPGTDCRWVYDPLSKPELSNVMSRRADGYELVRAKNLGGAAPDEMEPEAVIRVADVVLMGIPEDAKKGLEMDRASAAAESVQSIDRNFYKAIEEMEIPGADEKHRPRPIGRSIIEERDLEYDIPQRTGEEE